MRQTQCIASLGYLIKQAREKVYEADSSKVVYIDGLQIRRLGTSGVAGTNYKIKKFIVISNKPVDIIEETFLSSKISGDTILAVSLDHFHLSVHSNDKNYTNLYLVTDNGVR